MRIYKNKDITTNIDTEKMSINNSDTYFYTEDKGSAALRIFINYHNAPFNLDNTNLIPILDLLHSDGSVWFDEPLEVIMSDKGILQYNIPNNVISHAGRVKAKLFLRNAEQSVHVANFTFDIKDSGIEGAVEKEISVNLVDDAVRRIVKENAIEILGDGFEGRLNTDVINHLDNNPELFKGEKGDAFQYEDFTFEQLESLKGEKGDAFQYEDFTPEQLEGLKGEIGNTDKLITRNVVSSGENSPLITFVDDDGRTEVLEKWEPILQEKGNRLTIALVTQWMDDPNNTSVITWEDVHRFKKEHGVDFVSHTHEHKHATQMTDEEVDKEFKESKKILEREGLTHNIVVQPFGENTDSVRRISRKYYKANVGSKENINTTPLDTFRINRISLGEDLYTTFEQYKEKIDEAIANNGWIIFKSHSQYTSFDENQLQLIRQIIDYAREQQMLEVNLEEGLDLFGNLIDAGDYTARAQGIDYYVMDRYGKVHSNFGDKDYDMLKYNSVNINTPITEFQDKATSAVSIVSSNSQGFPNNTSGKLITTKSESLSLSYQLYLLYNSNDIYKRRWNTGTNNWTDFEKITGGSGESSKLTIHRREPVNVEVPANSYKDVDITVDGINNFDNVVVTPSSGIEIGLIYNGSISSENTVRIRFWNMTDSAVTTNRYYKIDIIKNR